MKDDYLEAYPELYRRHWWWRARERFVLEVVESRAPDGGWGRILDVGCGEGLLFPGLERYGTVEGVEPSAEEGSDAPTRDRIHRVPFDRRFRPGKRYGLMLMLDVLEHLDDPEGALAHAFSLLEDGGTLLITVPAFRGLWTSHDDLNRHRTRYRKAELAEELEGAGFRVDEMRYFFHWVGVAKLFVRAKESLFGSRPGVPSVPPAPANALLRGLSRVDLAVGSVLRPPFGSSLLAVAVRP